MECSALIGVSVSHTHLKTRGKSQKEGEKIVRVRVREDFCEIASPRYNMHSWTQSSCDYLHKTSKRM